MKRAGTSLILIAAAVMIAAGVALDQEQMVLMKAIYICLECIGIG